MAIFEKLIGLDTDIKISIKIIETQQLSTKNTERCVLTYRFRFSQKSMGFIVWPCMVW